MVPLVSILMTSYNYAHYIERAIASALAQTYSKFELIVVDDHSSDDTKARILKFTDPRIRFYENEVNLGPSGTWNKAATLAQGDYLTVLCADDTLPQTSLEDRVDLLVRSGMRIVHAGLVRIFEAAGQESLYIRPIDTSRRQNIINLLQGRINEGGINIATFMFDRALFYELGARDTDRGVHAHQDYEYVLRLLAKYPAAVLDKNTYNYHLHQDSILHRHMGNAASKRYFERMRDKYLEIFR